MFRLLLPPSSECHCCWRDTSFISWWMKAWLTFQIWHVSHALCWPFSPPGCCSRWSRAWKLPRPCWWFSGPTYGSLWPPCSSVDVYFLLCGWLWPSLFSFFLFLKVSASNFPTIGPRTLILALFKLTGGEFSYEPKLVQIGQYLAVFSFFAHISPTVGPTKVALESSESTGGDL